MKVKVFFILGIFFILNSRLSAQNFELKKDDVKIALVDFLFERNEVDKRSAVEYKRGNYTFYFVGVINDYMEDELKDGIYEFGTLASHTRVYFVTINEGKYEILDLKNREDLNRTLLRVLDFCEEKRLCVDIIKEYTQRVLHVYYNVNRFVDNEFDIDCYDYEEQKKNLP